MLEAIILGIVQGVTEFFPVSSTAHLILFPWFFDWGGMVNTLTFDVALHAGTLLALIIYFWRDWVEMATKKRKLLGLIVLATFPAGIAGLLLNDFVENNLRHPLVITVSLVLIGIVMFVSEKRSKQQKNGDIGLADALAIGLSQAFALIPGVSRSGITISAGLLRGLDRETSARFSFLMSTPLIAGATLLHFRKIISGDADYNLYIFLAGFLASAITSFAAIKFLLAFFRKHSLNVFVYYRFLLAGVIILGIWLKG
ncbi:MAG: undecaprenyl-diphosphate phosphatase [Nitrospirota bacterium]|nr:undecaprenyl-diphosphate phosphatase [Nitrospirota bacterium]